MFHLAQEPQNPVVLWANKVNMQCATKTAKLHKIVAKYKQCTPGI